MNTTKLLRFAGSTAAWGFLASLALATSVSAADKALTGDRVPTIGVTGATGRGVIE